MQSSQSMYNLSSVSSSQYVPSHLRQSHQRAPQQQKSSPPHLRRSSTTNKFGGPSFGTPKTSRTSRAQSAALEDAPPSESIYDFNGGSPFSSSQTNSTSIHSTQASGQKPIPSLASLPSAVIIFGFPSQMTSKVLDHFSRFGQIEEHTSSAAQNHSMGNNWMKITYRESTSAQQAVAANGTFVGGQYMIGCVYAQDEPLANVDNNQDDAMDIDPQTPPRSKSQSQYRPNIINLSGDNSASPYRTPVRGSSGQSNHSNSHTPGGKKIEILSSSAIYKSTSPITERATSWIPGWLAGGDESKVSGTPETSNSATSQGTTQTQSQVSQAPTWTSKMFKGLVDTIFGF